MVVFLDSRSDGQEMVCDWLW